ncbi:IS3 family transposase [Brevibacterium sp. JNUCC-42]|nr:IS3 family transposase [Brevibacterium sp. JNUCC-42]
MDIHERFKNKKRELIQGVTFKTPEQARKEIFNYIELYYNTKRIHSSLNYLSPIEFKKVYSLYSPNLVLTGPSLGVSIIWVSPVQERMGAILRVHSRNKFDFVYH